MKLSRAGLLQTLSNPDELKRLRNLKRPKHLLTSPANPAEDNIADWLGRLKLLHGVPFNYLVPDVDMLPMESIRFFCCDNVWLDYLVEGALSLGRSTTGDHTHDKAFLGDLHTFSRHGLKKQRGKALGHLSLHLSKRESKLFNSAPIAADERVTGFLLRSGVVSGWDGMQIEALNDKGRPCTVLRMDHLSPNVLLCIYEGTVAKVCMHEYPEVLHFGVDTSPDDGSFLKSYRYLKDRPDGVAGTEVKDLKSLLVSDFVRGKNGVLRINEMAEAMEKNLKESPQVQYQGSFNAAEFALEMVVGVEAVNFTIDLSK